MLKDGSEWGAHTIAILSGRSSWKPWCVWRSCDERKHDWVGCVWIQPSVTTWCACWNDSSSAGCVVSHVSDVPVCLGIKSVVMVSTSSVCESVSHDLPSESARTILPKSSPHVSIPRSVFSIERATNVETTSKGSRSVRSAPSELGTLTGTRAGSRGG